MKNLGNIITKQAIPVFPAEKNKINYFFGNFAIKSKRVANKIKLPDFVYLHWVFEHRDPYHGNRNGWHGAVAVRCDDFFQAEFQDRQALRDSMKFITWDLSPEAQEFLDRDPE
jgi:hypothetical protein